MIRSDYQTLCFDQEYVHSENTAVSPSLVERMSAFATGIAKGLERYWNIPANERPVRAEIGLFPTWYK